MNPYTRKTQFRIVAISWSRLSVISASLVFSLGLLTPTGARAGTHYALTNVGTPPGANGAIGVRMNNLGHVAGWSQYFGQGEPSLKGWVWTPQTGFTILPPPPGFYLGRSRAMDINDNGVVAGDGGFDIGLAWRYENGQYDVTGSVGGMPIAYLGGMNNAGDLAGTAKDSQFSTPDFAFVDINGGALTNLTPNGGRATDVNNAGQVCGYTIPSLGPFQAYRWDSIGGILPLGSLGLTYSFALRMNDAGQVVGYARSAAGNTQRAWIYTDGLGMRELPSPFQNSSAAVSLNNAGHVVGVTAVSGPDLTWLWTGGTTVTLLTDLFDNVAANVNVTSVVDINDAGQILARVFDNNAVEFRTVILTPPSVLGDINGDGVADVNDIPPFVAVLMGAPLDPAHVQRADLNADGSADGLDVRQFVAALIP